VVVSSLCYEKYENIAGRGMRLCSLTVGISVIEELSASVFTMKLQTQSITYYNANGTDITTLFPASRHTVYSLCTRCSGSGYIKAMKDFRPSINVGYKNSEFIY